MVTEEQLKAQRESIEQYAGDSSDSVCVYVGTFKKYNEGNLFGEWIDLAYMDDYDEFIMVCKKLHADEDDPEFMIQDTNVSWFSEEVPCEDEINDLIEISKNDYFKALDAYLDENGFEFHEDIDDIIDACEGAYDSEEDFAMEIAIEMMPNLEDNPMFNYIDWEAYARDLFISDYDYCNGYVFRCI